MRPDSWWSSLDADNAKLAADIKAEFGLTVTGFCHGHKPEFAEGESVPWDRIGEIASGSLHPPGTEAAPNSGPASRKKAKTKRPVKAKK